MAHSDFNKFAQVYVRCLEQECIKIANKLITQKCEENLVHKLAKSNHFYSTCIIITTNKNKISNSVQYM